MARDGDDSFFARWSRRKHAVQRGEAPAEPPRSEAQPPAPMPAPEPAAPPPPELPPVESLQGLESDYRDFLRPDVDPATKSAALKKLFGDPHFNRMDMLDTYVDDYTKEDPIPPLVLRALNQARTLGLFDDGEKDAKGQEAGGQEAGGQEAGGQEAGGREAATPPADAAPVPAAAIEPPQPATDAVPAGMPAKMPAKPETA